MGSRYLSCSFLLPSARTLYAGYRNRQRGIGCEKLDSISARLARVAGRRMNPTTQFGRFISDRLEGSK